MAHNIANCRDLSEGRGNSDSENGAVFLQTCSGHRFRPSAWTFSWHFCCSLGLWELRLEKKSTCTLWHKAKSHFYGSDLVSESLIFYHRKKWVEIQGALIHTVKLEFCTGGRERSSWGLEFQAFCFSFLSTDFWIFDIVLSEVLSVSFTCHLACTFGGHISDAEVRPSEHSLKHGHTPQI